jgi:hypothetical protein
MDLGPRSRERFDPDLFSSTDTFSGSRRKEDSVCTSINHRTDQAYPSRRSSPSKPFPKPSASPKAAQPTIPIPTPRNQTVFNNKKKWEESEEEEDSQEREFLAWKRKREEEWRRSKVAKPQLSEEGSHTMDEKDESSSCTGLDEDPDIPTFIPITTSKNQTIGRDSISHDRPLIPQQGLGGVLNNQIRIFT